MGQWESAMDKLLPATQDRGQGRGGNIEVALKSVEVSAAVFTSDLGMKQFTIYF